MNEPNTKVVMITSASVVVIIIPNSLNIGFYSSKPVSAFLTVLVSLGILSTNPNAIAPLIIPPHEMKISSLIVISALLAHYKNKKWMTQTAKILPIKTMTVITKIIYHDQGYV